jgi:hypothetical protein
MLTKGIGEDLVMRVLADGRKDECAQRSLTNPVGAGAAPCLYPETILGRGQGRAS